MICTMNLALHRFSINYGMSFVYHSFNPISFVQWKSFNLTDLAKGSRNVFNFLQKNST